MKNFFVFSFCLASFLLITGCGVSEKVIKDAEKRIEALSAQGVPDSSLSAAKVSLYQAKDASERGNFGIAKKAKKQMRILIAQAEDQFKNNKNRLKPWIQSQRQNIDKEISSLSGLNRKQADSVIAVIDSFVNIGWLLQAEHEIKTFSNTLKRYHLDEERGKELRGQVPGVWTCTQVTKHQQDKTVHAEEKKIFNFKKDGEVKLVEKKKGKSTPYFKEDWEFVSTGKYDLKGDTIVLFIERFKAQKQNFWDLKEVKGKKKWIMNKQPTYDSLITDGSQNRFITFNDLTTDFDRRKN